MKPQFSVEDLRTPERLELVLRQFSKALDQKLTPAKSPDLTALAAALAPLLRDQLQAGGAAPLNLTALLPFLGVSAAIVGTHAERITIYPPSNYQVGTIYYETDRTVVYIVTSVAGVLTWTYLDGICRTTLANRPTDLVAADVNFLLEVTDYDHILQWTGAAWTWGPGEVGSGYYAMYESAPNSIGANAWQVCDGTTVARLNADGSTTNVTTPNLATAAYLKGGTAAAAVAAASGLTTSVSAGTPSGTNSAPNTGNDTDAGFLAGAGATNVALNPHVHTTVAPVFTGNALAGHDHGPNTLELRNKQTALYYRR